jgi:hypothetical protein
MASVAATDKLIRDRPDAAAGAVHAIVAAHAALKADTGLAKKVGEKLFPPQEAELIEELIRRDLPYYDASISSNFVDGMNQFARDIGILVGQPAYTDVVAAQLIPLWRA